MASEWKLKEGVGAGQARQSKSQGTEREYWEVGQGRHNSRHKEHHVQSLRG